MYRSVTFCNYGYSYAAMVGQASLPLSTFTNFTCRNDKQEAFDYMYSVNKHWYYGKDNGNQRMVDALSNPDITLHLENEKSYLILTNVNGTNEGMYECSISFPDFPQDKPIQLALFFLVVEGMRIITIYMTILKNEMCEDRYSVPVFPSFLVLSFYIRTCILQVLS